MRLPTYLQDVTENEVREHVRALVQHCSVLPTIPGTRESILTLIDDINASLDDVEIAIARDPSCTARLLQTANSAFYGSGRLITSIRQAILKLGFNPIKKIAMSLPVFDSFRKHNTAEIAAITDLWRHSRAVAALSRRIADDIPSLDGDLAFCAGLLHDLSRVVLLYLFPEAYRQCLAQLKSSTEYDLLQAERDTVGVTHIDVGHWLAEAWHLPLPILHAIGKHHHTHSAQPLVMTVMLADHIVTVQRIGLMDGQYPIANPSRFAKALDLTPRHLKRYATYMRAESDRLQHHPGSRA